MSTATIKGLRVYMGPITHFSKDVYKEIITGNLKKDGFIWFM